ncbi:TonB-linked SusC/RagA family outer membrane protein [Algoriphagus sp. 4150]|uniref:SusC/RagA family TonB-linked outer membrane protein n=1 Tax=Algoriphagus sp. 4150 TaxID=2817756 RepID=UPI00285B9CDC|nr:TonB-dependent receptor [Algoriphagus sp. 4150]MDR7130225.1 TonB-linked SusC/RagA family outer membrane protein [Algoriphagus sp. 4150]
MKQNLSHLIISNSTIRGATYLLFLAFLFFGSKIQSIAQTVAPLTGMVVSADDQSPLPGVTVMVKGSSVGTVTDLEGLFSLASVSSNETLVFSFVGYISQEVPIQNHSRIEISLLPDIQNLEEIVVVGYGTQKKSDITGSIASVNETSLRDVPVSNLSDALKGRAAGLDIQKSGGNSKPGSNPTIRIRGERSVRAGNDPLFVLDGVPFNGSINDINPDDIVSVEILKDASSTAIYGSRGANGVILITTRRGKTGTPLITYSGYTGFNKNLGKFNIMNGEQFRDLKKWSRINGSAPGTYTGLDDPLFYTNGTFEPQEVESVELGRSTDWQDLIYKTGIITNHQLGISGGTAQSQYAISAGYFNETGIYPGQGFERFSLKMSADQTIGKRIKVGVSSLNSFTSRIGEGANPMGQVLRASPLATPYDNEGELWGFVPGSANQIWNPLADFIDGAVEEKRKRFGTFTTLYFDLELAEGLKYRFNGGAEIRADRYGNFYASATSYNLGGLSRSSNRSSFSTNFTLENLLTYDKTISEKHRINFTGLYSLQESLSESNQFDNNDILADVLEYYNPRFGANLVGSGNYQKWSILSYMGRLNYSFKDKYLLTLTVRTDGSSRLAPSKKYQTFPSVAAAWNITDEAFLNNSNTITNLKLRASYGTVGNAAVPAYATLGQLSPLVYNFGDSKVTGIYPTHAPNPNLEWEYTVTLNIGLDFGILRNRIEGSIEVYRQFTDKLLLPQNLPPTSGIPNAILTNVGKTENKGLEVQISTVNLPDKGRNSFSWTSNINLFLNRGKITQLAEGVTMDIGNNWFVGQPISTIYDYKKLGIWQNTAADSAMAKDLGLSITGTGSVIGTIRVADLGGRSADGRLESVPDGKIDGDDRTILGSMQPDFQGGITNRFAYRGFDFTIVAFGRVGGLIRSQLHAAGFANTYQGNYNNLVTDYWTPDNNQNYYPKPNSAATNTPYRSTLGYFDGSYLKIRSLSMGYTLSPTLASRIGTKAIRLYGTVNDAFILFSEYRNKYNGIDPESSGNLNVDTPAMYSVIFGVNVTL